MSRNSYYRKSKRYKKNNNKNILKYVVILIILVLASMIFIVNKSNYNSLNISLNNISAFKLSSENIIKLEEISKKYNIDFAEMLTYYALENNFFDEKNLDISNIEQDFIINYDTLKNKYSKKSVEPYYNLIKNILEDIKGFPISLEYSEEYIYGDSYGAERTYGGKRIHTGTDIMDRENIAGRIPIISMTNGVVENIGCLSDIIGLN